MIDDFEVRGPTSDSSPECGTCRRQRAPRTQVLYGRPICSECLKFHRIRERREEHEALLAKIARYVPGQGVELRLRGKLRKAEIVRFLWVRDYDPFASKALNTPQVELRYWTAEGDERTDTFKAAILP